MGKDLEGIDLQTTLNTTWGLNPFHECSDGSYINQVTGKPFPPCGKSFSQATTPQSKENEFAQEAAAHLKHAYDVTRSPYERFQSMKMALDNLNDYFKVGGDEKKLPPELRNTALLNSQYRTMGNELLTSMRYELATPIDPSNSAAAWQRQQLLLGAKQILSDLNNNGLQRLDVSAQYLGMKNFEEFEKALRDAKKDSPRVAPPVPNEALPRII